MSNTEHRRPGIWRETGALLRGAMVSVRAGGARLAALILVSQLLILGVALPVMGWTFREALRAGGIHGLDLGNFRPGAGFPLTAALIVVIILLAFWLLALQFTALVVLLRWPRMTGRGFMRELGRVTRKLARPGSVTLLLYLFLLLPLTGFGFASTFTRGIAIPAFISGELMKTVSSAVALAVFVLALVLLNIRLALTVPAFVLTTTRRPARSSWRLTRTLRHSVPLVLAVVAVLFVGGLVGFALVLIAIMPTVFFDLVAPGASHVVAAYSLGAAQVAGFMITGVFTALVAGVLITGVRRWSDRLPDDVALIEPAEGAGVTATGGAGSPAPQHHRSTPVLVAVGALVAAAVFGSLGLDTMQRLSNTPETLVLGHRGFPEGGVENTISSLDAAAEVEADLVEMDIMQTKDGGFVVMHDANLERLTGENVDVKDLTLDEITAMTVHDLEGHEDAIPSLAEYATHAHEIGMPLLIEIKLSGAETDDHVDMLVAELEELDLLHANIYHSLDAPSVERLKLIRPDLTVGYTMAFAAVDVPDTTADFIVIEEWTATEQMQAAAERAGLGFMAWTLNDAPGMREHLRRGTDGIITDHPDQVVELRGEMQQETGLSDVLIDALSRFVTFV
ncbi:MAG: glycerophosphoryl diester phosphodiesterase membrane domain-containing protein [Leucobacter sp.]